MLAGILLCSFAYKKSVLQFVKGTACQSIFARERTNCHYVYLSFLEAQLYLNQISRLLWKNSFSTAADTDMGPPKAWFKLVNLESAWSQVPLTEVENVDDLKIAIKSKLPELDAYSPGRLTLKATKMDIKEVVQSTEQDSEKKLVSILKDFDITVTDDAALVQKSFAENIRLFVFAPGSKYLPFLNHMFFEIAFFDF